MKRKLKFLSVSLVIFALVTNLHSAFFTFYGFKDNSLSGQVWAQTTSSDSDPGGDPGEGDLSGKCTDRGGTEMPNSVLQVVRCTATIELGGFPPTFKYVRGNQCQCSGPPSGYQGVLGCNLTWETGCSTSL